MSWLYISPELEQKLHTQKVVVSMTATLLAYMRGDVGFNDLCDLKFWFNCHRCHLFPEGDTAPYEITWARKDDTRYSGSTEKGQIPVEALTGEERIKLKGFREIIQWAEEGGDVSWRDDREKERN